MIEPGHWSAVRNETMVSVAINALIPTAIIWLVGLAPPERLDGETGLLQAMTKASGLATTLMTLVVTLLIRARVRSGAAPALPRASLPTIIRWLPGSVLLRAPVMGLIAVALLVPTGAAFAAAFSLLPLTIGGFVVFNLIYGTIVGLVMTPGVVLRALVDPVRAR